MEKVYCLCGCEKEVKSANKYINGHVRRGMICSKETRAKMSAARKGKGQAKKLKSVGEQE